MDEHGRAPSQRRRGPGELLVRRPMAVLWVWCAGAAAIGAVVLAVVADDPTPASGGPGAQVFAPVAGGPVGAEDVRLSCEDTGSTRGVNAATVDGATPTEDRLAAARRWAEGSGTAGRFPGYSMRTDGVPPTSVVVLSDGSGRAPVAVLQFEEEGGRWRLSTIRSC